MWVRRLKGLGLDFFVDDGVDWVLWLLFVEIDNLEVEGYEGIGCIE